ncbi:MAG: glycogen debranching enzyme N-terminal domain-containing protein, partial [Lentisphaeria bacterium]|nr:glycogen debranching enzyme N-terminal domain-containing protein [Lentisphaeria bacterium]
GEKENLCTLICTLNRLLSTHPAFSGTSQIKNITSSDGEALAVMRSGENGESGVLVLLNPDCENSSTLSFAGTFPDSGKDLLSGETVTFYRKEDLLCLDLAPGDGFAVEIDESKLSDIALCNEVKLMEKKAFVALHGWKNEKLPEISFTDSPEQFVAELASSAIAPLTVWQGEQDTRRIIPVPCGDLLLVKNPYPFRCIIKEESSGFIRGVPLKNGSYGALLVLEKNSSAQRRNLDLHIGSFENGNCRILKGKLCQLPEYRHFNFRREYSKSEVKERELLVFGSNDSGSYAMFPAGFGSFPCKYHSILAVNNDPAIPVDRYCMFTGLHIYLTTEGYSRKIDENVITKFFSSGENCFRWHFRIPAGQGRHMDLEAEFKFPISGEAVELRFFRPANSGVPDSTPVAIILRPELEDRINHHVTKACNGPEWKFPHSVTHFCRGFSFAPAKRKLTVETSCGTWHQEPEWHYMCDLPSERYYGLEDKTDRFSPGYFHVPLKEKESFTLSARTVPAAECSWPESAKSSSDQLVNAMRRFIVKRNDLNTVIAGFPWFLDWGRDTLIALRGLVKVPEFRPGCTMILRAFAGFEKHGTLPNVMHGANDANRDTSDAPLYLILGVRDYIAETGNETILDSDCSGRKLRDVISSIINSFITGTPNGIKMDHSSGLIFSPAHFTWMDTNFPAGTPREGYPVEIQALWYACLKFAGHDTLAAQVQESIEKYFFPEYYDCCSDCLHGVRGT